MELTRSEIEGELPGGNAFSVDMRRDRRSESQVDQRARGGPGRVKVIGEGPG